MQNSTSRWWLGFAGAAAALLTSSLALANPVLHLPGRWSGPGGIVMANGTNEEMRCIATYFLEDSGAAIRQNLRCASQGFKIEVVTNLKVADGRVSGTWEERIWDTKGAIKGNIVPDGFGLTIDGPGFSAAMAVKTTNCTQSINITPRAHDVARIFMNLGKC